MPRPSKEAAGDRGFRRLWLALVAVSVAGFILTYYLLVEAPPPDRVTIATGREDGRYFAFAQEYSRWLESHFDVELEVRSTAGTGENLRLLLDPDSDVSVAMVQGGVPVPGGAEGSGGEPPLLSLGSLYREPLWVFYRGAGPIEFLSGLAGRRIAVGSRSSGTFPVARTLLEANGIRVPDEDLPDGSALDPATGTRFLFLGGQESARALVEETADAAFMVVGAEVSYVQELLATQGIRVLSFGQWESYVRRFGFLSHVALTRGLVDLGRNIPPEDVHLLAPTATLVIRRGTHPSLASLLVQAAHDVHEQGGLLSAAGEFPSPRYVDLPLSPNAELFYEHGPPLLQRWVGFHWAIWIDRLKVMLLPLVVLLFPLIRLAPPVMRWRIRVRIYRWYAAIRDADRALKEEAPGSVLQGHLERLRRIAVEVTDVRVPLSYMHEFYSMRFHLSLVEGRLEKALAPEASRLEE